MSITLRHETHADIEIIRTITERAFAGKPYAGGNEQDVIDLLRDKGALVLSLVAIREDELVGHIAFSPVALGDTLQPWFALGPVSVLPEWQGQGIGTQLIERGLSDISSAGALGCILTGNPLYYKRFGFDFSPQSCPENESPEVFMVKCFSAKQPHGRFRFDSAFYE
ncbi:MAG: GNAT family N-acetyltransferase [Halioglobus sp.]